MKRALPWFWGLAIVATVIAPGCLLRRADYAFREQNLAHYQVKATELEYPDVDTPSNPQAGSTPAPITIPTGPNDPEPEYWNLTLEEAVQTALQNSAVIRDLGALVLQSPATSRTIQNASIVETDPRFGTDAALSAFDASFAASAFFEKNDRALNNEFFGGGTRILKQDLHAYRMELSKRDAYGGLMTARATTDYDFNNSPGNQFPAGWTQFLEAEMRQPLLQGMGAQFNRIAGPGAVPGLYNGVLIARMNTDISLADFELGMRNFVNDVETAYWELYFAYRDLDTKLAARDRALETWRIIRTWNLENRRGGEADKEAQAREQYYRLEEEVQNAVAGHYEDRIRLTAFRGIGGVQTTERRLRLMMGVPITDVDRRLIRPAQDPRMVKVVFQWEDALEEALTRREELRRQKWLIKRREMELLASRNFLYPKLDAIGRYRWRGFGRSLLDSSGNSLEFDNAWENLLSGNFQEWQMGVEFNMPIGYRKAHAAVRNAQLFLARERAMLDEQEREVAHDLSSAMADMERAYAVSQTNYNRRLAAKTQLDVLTSNFKDVEGAEIARMLDLLLDAQRRLAESESRYFRSLAEYEMAVKNVHYQKGSLLDYNDVFLSEGPWPAKAYDDAAKKARQRGRPWELSSFALSRRPPIVSQGFYGPANPEIEMSAPGGPGQPLASGNPTPPAGFDHMPPGGAPAIQTARSLEPVPGEFGEGAARPVRLMPDPSVESPAIPGDLSPVLNRRAAANEPSAVDTDFDDSRDRFAIEDSSGTRQPAVRHAPTDAGMRNAKPTSYGSGAKSLLPWQMLPFGRLAPAKSPRSIPEPQYPSDKVQQVGFDEPQP